MIRALITGYVDVPGGRVPVVSTSWSRADRLGEIRSRLSNFRMDYAVPPGLYAVGAPGPGSDVLVSANYKLSFDKLRRELKGRDLWILVIDTAGINVWCAAGEGTFGTDELARRIQAHGLGVIVTHRRIIVPQLGAPGVSAGEVKKRTGFRVHFGPVRAADLPDYLDAGLRASPSMRIMKFGFIDRLVLTPMELMPVMKKISGPALILLAVLGLEPAGIIFDSAWTTGVPVLLLALAGIMAGAFLTPLLLPLIPSRSFALKGFLTGIAVNALLVHGAGLVPGGDAYLTAFTYLLFPVLSSYLALQFTGATVYTGISGVKKELKYALPAYAVLGVLSLAALAAHKIISWGMI
jgi:acetyl-CoA decarbonylase/synthase complex subunit gamma